MSRPILIFLGGDEGEFRTARSDGLIAKGYFPVASVDTFEQANWLKERTCEPASDGRFLFRGFTRTQPELEVFIPQRLEELFLQQFHQAEEPSGPA